MKPKPARKITADALRQIYEDVQLKCDQSYTDDPPWNDIQAALSALLLAADYLETLEKKE